MMSGFYVFVSPGFFPFLLYFDLAQLHCRQRSIMRSRCHAGTRCRINDYICLRKCSLTQNRVGKHANSGTQSHQLDLQVRIPKDFLIRAQFLNQLHGAKGWLLNFSPCIHLFFFQRLLHCRAQAMSIRSLNAMCNRKMMPLFCLQILFRMRVLRHINLFCRSFFDFADDVLYNRLSLLCSKAPCKKIVLHVYYDQKLHKILPYENVFSYYTGKEKTKKHPSACFHTKGCLFHFLYPMCLPHED